MIPGTPEEVVSRLAEGLPLVSNATFALESIPSDDAAAAPTTGLVIHYDLNVQAVGGAEIARALWEGDLLVGAVADEFAARNLDTVIGARGVSVTPQGQRQPAGGGIGRGRVVGQVFDQVPADLADAVTARARELGLREVKVFTVRAIQEAVVIEAKTDTPQATARRLVGRAALGYLLGDSPTRYEGVFLSVADGAGDPVWMSGVAPRAGASTAWVRPGLGIELGHGFARPK